MAHRTLLSTVQPNHVDCRLLKWRLDQGASPDECDDNGNTCLHLLAGSDHPLTDQCVDLLLDYGAHCNVRTRDEGLTPLHIAANWGNEDLVRRLLSAGADVTAVNHDNETARDLAPNSSTADLLQLCTDSVGLTVLLQQQTTSVLEDGGGADPRFFESTVLYDISDLTDTDAEEDCGTVCGLGDEQSPASGSPWDAACYYSSDDSVLNPTDSDTTPVQRCSDHDRAVYSGSSPPSAYSSNDDGGNDDGGDGRHDSNARQSRDDTYTVENADTVDRHHHHHQQQQQQQQHPNHLNCSASPVLRTDRAAQGGCHSATSSGQSPRSILKNRSVPASPPRVSPASTNASPLTACPRYPIGPIPSRSKPPSGIRDTTFRLSIGSPSIPSQSLLGSDETGTDEGVPVDAAGRAGTPGMRYIEARKPWHSVGDSAESDKSPQPADGTDSAETGGQDDVSQLSGSMLCSPESVAASLIIPDDVKALSNAALRARLTELGENVGPVTDGTRSIYQRYLTRCEARAEADVSGGLALSASTQTPAGKVPSYSKELYRCLAGRLPIPSLAKEEANLQPPVRANPRAGVAVGKQALSTPTQDYVNKAFFIYFLLDPAISCNLPLRAANDSLSELDCFRQFMAAIFYIGKGKRSRPFAHLHDAAKYCQSTGHGDKSPQPKLERIKAIWRSGLGVVQFSCFQGTTSHEAHTREACCLDAIGLANLTNKVSGTYYGVYAGKSATTRRDMGVYLLAKACRIFLQEGERQYHSSVPVP